MLKLILELLFLLLTLSLDLFDTHPHINNRHKENMISMEIQSNVNSPAIIRATTKVYTSICYTVIVRVCLPISSGDRYIASVVTVLVIVPLVLRDVTLTVVLVSGVDVTFVE